MAEKDSINTAVDNQVHWHFGYVQLVVGTDGDKTSYVNESSFFAMGFPIGIGKKISNTVTFDLEFVPFISPFFNTGKPYDSHLLFHPGVIFSLGHNWSFGTRLAFETGKNQFGFTPLINKSFPINSSTSAFLEVVTPIRYGPAKHSSFYGLLGLHFGVGF